jgi:hypothetical protein
VDSTSANLMAQVMGVEVLVETGGLLGVQVAVLTGV